MELIGHIQHYDWGRIGHNSVISMFFANIYDRWKVDPKIPYAELWLGCHANGEARLKDSKEPLSHYLKRNPDVLGASREFFGDNLPFLVKVLSVHKALSIQVHPDKEVARQLHLKFPERYKDANHKPELTIALTPSELLIGFRPISEIKSHLKHIKELSILIPSELIEDFIRTESEDLLKLCFQHLLTATELELRKTTEIIFSRLKNADAQVKAAYLYSIVEKLHKQFPFDVGIFTPYFLNYVSLKPEEACYISPGTVHCYITGDCVEIQATSDNVVRAGLTPKFKDVDTLLQIVDFSSLVIDEIKYVGSSNSKYETVFKLPISDFGVTRYTIPPGMTFTLPALDVASIFLLTDGLINVEPNKTLKCGASIFLPAKEDFTFEAKEKVMLYRSYANV